MELINKGVAWARNICKTLEAMCLEVDDIMFKQHAEWANGSQDDMLLPTSDEVAGSKSFKKAGETNGSGDDMSPPISDEVAGCKSFRKAEETNGSEDDMSPPTSDEVAGCKFFGKAGETGGGKDEMSPPTSDEDGGCKYFGKAGESGNLVNAIAHPSGALLSSCSETCGRSIECEDNPAASAIVPEIELSHYSFEAYNKFAESEHSVSIPEIGKSDDKRCISVAEPSKATIQASDNVKLDCFMESNVCCCAICEEASHRYLKVYAPELLSHAKASIQASNYARIDDDMVMESSERCSAFCKAANNKYCKESQASETGLVIEEDKKLQAGDDAAGSNQQHDHDLWESEWVIV